MVDRRDYYRRWYAENKEKVAQKRAEKYHNDPEYRKKHKAHGARYYWLKKRRAKALRMYDIDVDSMLPDEIADVIISNEDDIRCDLAVPVPMFYPSSLGKCIGRHVQTIRLWSLKGLIPESTYRNRANYRLFTKDQVKVFVEHLPLLVLHVKDFSNHPYFSEVRAGLENLEPDGIEVMPKDKWKLVDEPCNWCKSIPSLYYLEDNNWKKVQCFSCRDPYDIEGRISTRKQYVTGYCEFCDCTISDDVYVIGRLPMLICKDCGTRATNVEIHKGGKEG